MNCGKLIRNLIHINAESNRIARTILNSIHYELDAIGKNLWTADNNHSMNLFLIMDMLKNANQWKSLSLLNETPEIFLTKIS